MGLARIWPHGLLRCLVALDPAKKAGAKTRFFQDGEEHDAWAKTRCAEGWDVYGATAGYAGQKRTAANVGAVKAFWADLDCGEGRDYPDQSTALKALVEWHQSTGFPFPTILINSGYGLHAYWLLDAPVDPARWKATAERFKGYLAATGLRADPSRTADIASIMRYPGTINFKQGRQRPVTVIRSANETISIEEFERHLPVTGLPARAGAPLPMKSEFTVEVQYPPAEPGPILKNCAQVRQVAETRGKVSEPLWRAGLSVALRCVGGDDLIHAWSAGHPEYDPAETRAKAERTGGPATCAHFEGLNPMPCMECPKRGKLTSPILFGTLAPAAEAPPSRDLNDTVRLSEVGPFRVTDQGIRVGIRNEQNEVVEWEGVTRCPLWVRRVQESAAHTVGDNNTTAHVIEWVTSGGEHKEARLQAADLYEPKAFIRWCANQNLMSEIIDLKQLVIFMTGYIYEIIKRQQVQKFYDHLGWYKDGFVMGSVIVGPEGPRPARVQSTSPIAKLTPSGSAEEWGKAAAILGRPEYYAQAFPMLASFGSPLLNYLTHKNAAVLSLVGESGRGKSVSAQFALSIWGLPRHLFQPATATEKAVEVQIACNQHVPFLLDEISNLKPSRIGNFVLSVVNGSGRSSLTQGREFRDGGEWANVVMVTTNQAIKEFDPVDIADQHHQRILEVHVDTAIRGDHAEQLISAGNNNPGAAGMAYIQFVQQNAGAIPGMFEAAEKYLCTRFKLPSENRFCIWLLAASLVGGQLARQCGLIAFDPIKVVDIVAALHSGMAMGAPRDEIRFPNELAAWMASHRGDICFWPGHSKAPPVDIPRKVLARYDASRDVLIIPAAVLREFLHETGMSMTNLKKWLKANGVTTTAAALAPQLPPVWAHHVTLKKLGLKMNDGTQED